jgi:hypothetical protein
MVPIIGKMRMTAEKALRVIKDPVYKPSAVILRK